MSRTTIVIPCYNEVQRLPVQRLTSFAGQHPALTFLLVNDGSTDDTGMILDRLARRFPTRFFALQLVRNAGKGEAVRQGLLAAANFPSHYAGYWDADLATPLAEIPRFAAVLDRRADVQLVCGVRCSLLGRQIERRPLRCVLGRLFAAAAGVVLGHGVSDTQCGAKLFRQSDELTRVLQAPFLSRWIFDVELLARLSNELGDCRSAVYELPVDEWRDVGGSKVRPRDFLRAAGELMQIAWQYRITGRRRQPVAVERPRRRLLRAA